VHAALFVAVLLTVVPHASSAELQVAGPIGDGAVIQRDAKVPVSGSAAAGAQVVVTFGGASHATRADAAGRWRVELPPIKGGGPHEMAIASGEERLLLTDLMVGDVWLCSGQSNMEWSVADSLDAAKEIAAARDSMIRHFQVPRSWAGKPEASLAGGVWEQTDPGHVGSFTAVGYFFARELRRHLTVPIGLINATWGGSRIEPWMSAPALGLAPADVERILAGERIYEQEVLGKIRARIGDLPDHDEGLVDGRALWAVPDLDDSGWGRIAVPSQWEDAGFDGMDGIAWYRTSLELTADEAKEGVRLGLGMIDDSDIAWVNGREIGRSTLAWNRARAYDVSPALLRPGRNVVAVRVEDTGGGGGIWGKPDLLYVEIAGRRRPLAGEWKFKPALVTVNLDFHKNQVPTVLFNKMIYPLEAYPIRGVLWYQGESNAGPEDALAYRKLFPALIADWRAGWDLAALPFLWVQLASYLPNGAEPSESSWALLRESQSKALALPVTAQVVTIDVGDAHDIHPRNKQEVGRRLALAARTVAYGERVVFSGPAYKRHEVRRGKVVIEFTHIGQGLVAKGVARQRLEGFTIAGADRRFLPADAAIQKGRVVVWNDLVPDPIAVRYAWADDPERANLFNLEGLPASPFRTDSW
jgi:sialate O-acetylesterase